MNPEVERIIREATPLNGQPNAPTDAPFEIDAAIGDLNAITRLAWSVIEARNVPPRLFLHGTLPVRIEHDDHGAPHLIELTADRLRHELATFALWRKETRHGMVDVPPPMHVIRNVMATPDMPLPVLTRIVEVPVFTPDGSLVATTGYHVSSGIYLDLYDPRLTMSFPEYPTVEDIQRAHDLLDELLSEFPFVADADRTHAVGLFILPFVRDMIEGSTPMHCIEAPEPGTGKGLLAEVMLSPAVGHHLGLTAEAKDDDEWRKRITARLREGCLVTVIDNLSRPLTSGVVSAALTMRRWEDRLLGRNETVSVPVRTIWVLTANNPILSREIARRSIRIRLDSRRDRPWMREGFRHSDLRGWAHAHRADLVWAALVLVRAWLVAGRPAPRARPLGSFEDWTCLVGGILEHAGYQGFLANALDFYERADSEGSAWRAFTSQWWEVHGDAAVGTKDLLTIAKEIDGFSLGRSTTENGQRNSLGKRLRKSVDRVIGDLRIEVAGTYQNSIRWRLRCLTPAEMPAASPEAADVPPSASPEEEEVDLRRAGRQP